jgi:VCBS repeat-containing protein
VSGPAHGSLTLNADGSFTYTPDANYNGADSFTYKANDGVADSGAVTVSLTVDAVNDAPLFTPAAMITIREHLINAGLNGFDSKIVGSVAASDTDGDSVVYSIVSDSSGGAFEIDASTGQVTVRDVSLLDYEGGGLSSDDSGSYYTVTMRASDGSTWTDQSAKIYLTNVDSTDTTGSDNFVDGNSDGNSFSLNNGNDVAFGDGGNDTLTGNLHNDRLFGGAGNDSLAGSNGDDVLYGGAGVDTLLGGNQADTFVFGHGWDSGVDTIADFKRAEGDTVLLVNDHGGLFTALGDGTLSGSQFRSGNGATAATSSDHRIIYDTTTGNLYFDHDGLGGDGAVLFATLSKVSGSTPTLLAGDILAGPPPGP